MLKTKTLALIVAFTSITIVLNPIGVPALYLPGYLYRIWDIPIIAAFLLFGFRFAVSIAVLNGVAQLFLFPRPMGVLAPIWFFLAVFSLLLGLYLATYFLKRRVAESKTYDDKKSLIYFTTLGILARTAILPFVDYAMYRFLLPLVFGRALPDSYILAMMPLILIFIFSQTLLQVPVGFFIAKTINRKLKVGTQIF